MLPKLSFLSLQMKPSGGAPYITTPKDMHYYVCGSCITTTERTLLEQDLQPLCGAQPKCKYSRMGTSCPANKECRLNATRDQRLSPKLIWTYTVPKQRDRHCSQTYSGIHTHVYLSRLPLEPVYPFFPCSHDALLHLGGRLWPGKGSTKTK